MNDSRMPSAPPSEPARDAKRDLPWFTADELPLPPPEMRRPPEGDDEPTLFDLIDDGENVDE